MIRGELQLKQIDLQSLVGNKIKKFTYLSQLYLGLEVPKKDINSGHNNVF